MPRDLFVRCPMHGGGNERTPSLSIVLQDRGNLRAGYSRCFACGWTGNWKQVESALGYRLDIDPATRAMLEERSNSHFHTKTQLRTAVAQGTPSQAIKKEELPFKFSQYLKERGIGEVVQRFNKVYQNGHLNMPFFDPYGNYMGSIERSTGPDKFYKVNGSIEYPIGIEEVKSSDFVYITEGQIDKMSLEEAGFRAVALGSVSNYKLLKHIKNFNICLAFDNDEAGMKGTELAFQYIRQKRVPNVYMLTLPHQAKDVNELLVDMKRAGESIQDISAYIKANTRRL